jgi:hypothetical protein
MINIKAITKCGVFKITLKEGFKLTGSALIVNAVFYRKEELA